MWHALRAEIAYFRPWLLGGYGIASGVIVIISIVFFTVGDDGPPAHVADGLRGMFLIIATMVVGFIVQAYRSEERRSRLLLAGPLTPRQLAAVTLLLPVVLFAIGIIAAALIIGLGAVISGRFEAETLNLVCFVGGQFFTYSQLGLLAAEATAAHGQRRLRAREVGWTSFVVGALFLAVMYLGLARESLTWYHLILGHLGVAMVAMVASFVLYTGRTDFTR